ncbi:MAG: DNA methyltransferase [Dehalococcoidia bacterium]|jgi:DNA modification methylase/superfamily II DNA or RNA helicase
MIDYKEFLSSKRIANVFHGNDISTDQVHPMLFPFQRDVVRWAVGKGRAAIFLDTGLGKTFVQLEWARLLDVKTLIVAPLSVARQTVREGHKIDIDVQYVRHQDEVKNKICITNYEMIDSFDPAEFEAVVLDESSILKSFDGVTRRKMINLFADTKYRLACTATPAPNDQAEIGNHSEFLGVATVNEMLAMFFVHANKVDYLEVGDGRQVKTKRSGSQGQEWRLKNHATESFYKWMSSWAISLRKPSDLGYDDDGYILPELSIIPKFIAVDYKPDDQLFFTGLAGIQDRHKVRVSTIEDRISEAIDIIDGGDEQWIVWCGLQSEADQICKILDDYRQVQGSDTPEYKAQAFEDFQDKKYRILVTKPKIAGFGMNFQNAHNMLFLGLSDSWEAYYQCIRREWRFGQKEPVNVHIVLSEAEREIYANVMQKEAVAKNMSAELIKHVQKYEEEEIKMGSEQENKFDYAEKTIKGDKWTAMLGDSCQRMKELAENSIHLSVYSPPFADLYTYSASELDLGNSRNWDEFFKHYAFIIRELLRVTKPGRLTCAHTSDIPAMGIKDGYIGMRDFPGAVIAAYEKEGWTFIGRAIVGKNPQAQAIRTKAQALLFATLKKDSSDSRPAILDQILIFKKDGDNEVPVKPVENGEMNNETWIDWAGGIWTGIHESDTLQYTTARAADDEKHICPLQLGTIERCIKLYSNPGETVFTPFMGIGSEAYQAIRFGRKAIGIELKESYFKIAVKNLTDVEQRYKSIDLFTFANQESL